MSQRKVVTEALADFKSARDAMLDSNADDFLHHLTSFIREFDRNQLCKTLLAELPSFDANAWWDREVAKVGEYQRLETLNLPENKNERLLMLLDLARSFGSGDRQQISAEGFGRMFGLYKRDEYYNLAKSLVLRPLAEEFTRRLRDAADMANPGIRELAGVPLSRIPHNNEVAIFLSHKWINKDIVRRYHQVLQQVGFEPWIDDNEVVAGDVLHRALLDGMDRSCAAVFFVTSEFADDRWISREVDLAINRKVKLGAKFQIITLVIGNVQVPRPLQEYVYIKVENDLDGLRSIIRALPIELGPSRWKESVVK